MMDPVISPDGRTIFGWFSMPGGPEKNVSLPIAGGTPTEIAKEANMRNVEVDRDGTLWFTGDNSGRFRKIESSGRMTDIPGPAQARFQTFLPDGHRALMVKAQLGTTAGPVILLDAKNGKSTPVTNEPVVEIRYGAGYVAYTRNDGTLWAARFDQKSGTMTSAPVQVGAGVSLTGTGLANFALSRSGNLAYVPEEPRWLALVDRDGKLRNATSERRSFHSPRFSPDGDRISVDFSSSSGRDVWILSLKRGTMSRATFDRDGHDATWMRDGQYITYTSFRHGRLGVFRTKPGGGARSDSVIASTLLGYTGDWLSDGKRMITTLTDIARGSGSDIGIIENSGSGPVRPLISDQFQTLFPAVSRDEKWLAFVSDQSGSQEVYVRPLEGDGEDVQVSLNGGTEPLFSPDGHELFYRAPSERGTDLIAATVRGSPTFDVVARRTLFPVSDMAAAVPHANYDISPDGRTFVLVRRSPSSRIIVIQNLPALVKSIQAPAKENP